MKWFTSTKETKQFPQMITVYLSSEYEKILIAPFFVDESWVHYEQEDIEVLRFDTNDEVLGESIKRNLNKFQEKNAELTKRKKKDWPAYKASNLRTVQEFESKFSRISISGLNEANLILAFDAETKSKDEIDLRTTISAYADNRELGVRLRKLHKAQIERKIE
ncbi:hypothetical protein KEM09_20745 [Carboxylicivirga mesophila]|uniref:Uncharacterized protein n=1 Tax=Carboxylicivirga mesophila TaxID=1166478 RepID=A0ABS5KFL2_9BACT|nr:hypothetical protein [Carboxylicivirga mesophila]MBS2213849.1 hypothetical protein [Carboxylicivirga mesophila]